MIPQLEDFGFGYNELEKMEVIRKHYAFFKESDKIKVTQQQQNKEDQIRDFAEKYLKTDLPQPDEEKILLIIQSLEEEHASLLRKQNLLQKNTEYELVSQNINLLERLQELYKEKLDLSRKNATQLKIITSLLNQVYSLNKQFTLQMDDLSKYNSQLPNERELELNKQNIQLKQELDYYKQLNSQVEYVQSLLLQAESTKSLMIEQLKKMKNS